MSDGSRSSSKAKIGASAHVPFSLETVHLQSLVAETTSTTTPVDFSKNVHVAADSLISFVGGVDDQTKADLLNSTLLAQLAATEHVGGPDQVETHLDDWYSEYKRVLNGIGWVVQDVVFRKWTSAAPTAVFTLETVVLDVLKAALTPDELAGITAALKAITSLDSGDRRLKLYGSLQGNSGHFQVGVASVDGRTPVLKLAYVQFQYDASVRHVLRFRFVTSRTRLYTGQQSMSLNEDAYCQVRDGIVAKLGTSATALISSLDI